MEEVDIRVLVRLRGPDSCCVLGTLLLERGDLGAGHVSRALVGAAPHCVGRPRHAAKFRMCPLALGMPDGQPVQEGYARSGGVSCPWAAPLAFLFPGAVAPAVGSGRACTVSSSDGLSGAHSLDTCKIDA